MGVRFVINRIRLAVQLRRFMVDVKETFRYRNVIPTNDLYKEVPDPVKPQNR